MDNVPEAMVQEVSCPRLGASTVEGLGFRVQVSGVGVEGLGFRV